MDFKVNVDVKKLFNVLCPACQEKFLDLAELKPDRESMRAFFQETPPTPKKKPVKKETK